jgi:glycosyltransferase involved in cell wall biosynthesis
MRVITYTDYVYRQIDGTVYAERAFALFLASLREHVDELTIVGRLDPDAGPTHYALPDDVRFVSLPHYDSLTQPRAVMSSLTGSVRRFWRELDDADTVWLLGPYPHAVAFAFLTRLRRRPLVLGVRQDFPRYVRSRRPGRRWLHYAADALELIWRRLARRSPVVVVGAELAERYRHAPEVLDISVSLISSEDVEAGSKAAGRSYGEELQLLSVGRIDEEKNPLLLADVLAALREQSNRWRLVVCGEGPLLGALGERLALLGVDGAADLRGYVAVDGDLLELYRASHVFLHVSLTEGVPQVLLEAFASGTPVVATAVGGVPAAAGGAALLIPPRDLPAAVDSVQRLIAEPELRERLQRAGLEVADSRTLERESGRVAQFIGRQARRGAPAPRPDARAGRRAG